MKKNIILTLAFTIIFSCCSQDKTKRTWNDDYTFEDNIDSSYNSNEHNNKDKQNLLASNSSNIENAITIVDDEIRNINSPDVLMENLNKINLELQNISNIISSTSDIKKQEELEKKYKKLEEEYNNKLKQYSLPANGIIQNINRQTERLNKCFDKKNFQNILDTHYSFLNNLSKIHYIVEEKNRQSEVRELAEKLQQLYNEKKTLFGY